MNATDSREHEVLARTLDEVRRVRRRRTTGKLAVFPVLMLLGAGWLALSRGPSPSAGRTEVVMAEPPRTTEPAHESLTVVEWKSGMPSLVEYSGEKLGKLELSFSLDPVVAFPDEAW
jgi:hypothetical protein